MSNVILFWKSYEPYGEFSSWYESDFIDENNIKYNSVHQYMLYQKALLFNDFYQANQIINCYNINECDILGKNIKNTDKKTWDEYNYDITYYGNLLKFSQFKNIKDSLLETNNKIIGEASPHNKIWSIGYDKYDSRAYDVKKWRGQNKAGNILMDVRETLKY